MLKISKLIIKLRYATLITVAILSVFLGYNLLKLKVNPDILSYLPDNDSEAALFEKIGKMYSGNQTAVIGIEAESIYTLENIGIIKKLTDTIKYTDGVSSVASIADVVDIKDVGGIIEIGKLIGEYNFPQNQEDIDSLKHYIHTKDLYKGLLVSEDGTLAMIAFKIKEGFDKMEVAESVKETIKSINPNLKIYYGGLPYMLKDIGQIIMDDISFLSPFALLVIIVILFFSFRSFKSVLLPVITVLVSIIWTMGLMGLLGFEITLVTNVTPVILIAVGSAYSIHVVNRLNKESNLQNDNKLNIINGLKYIIVPVFFASITTVIGFLSFIFGSYLTMISAFGVFTAVGVFFSLLLSVTLVPALYSFTKPNNISDESSEKTNTFLYRVLSGLYQLIINKPRLLISIWIIITVVFIIGINFITRKVDLMDYFKQDSPSRYSENILRKKLGGTLPIYINFKGNCQSPELLSMMDSVSNFLKATGKVSHTQSVADMIKEMNEIMGEGKQIPTEEDKIFNLWFLLEGQEIMTQFVSPELDEALLQGTVCTSEMDELNSLIDTLNKYITNIKYENVEVEVAGFPNIYRKLDESLLSSQMQSLLIAIILVFISISLLLKSIKQGLYTAIPIIVTLIVLYGAMGILQIPLDVATVMVGSISIGIGIDYAIHLISYYNNELKSNNFQTALLNSIQGSGKAIVINVVSVSLGFLVLLFSDLVPLKRFGLLVTITMITSGLASLTLLPSIFVLINKKNIEK